MPLTTDELRRLDRRHVWHPFTHHTLWDAADDNLVITDADGLYLIDSDGNRYLDGAASIWCNVHGHRVPAIDAAIVAQLGRVAHSTLLGLANEPSVRLAAKLASLAPPGLEKVFFADAGACATEVAFKLAAQYWFNIGKPEKRTFLGFADGYHGDTVGAMSVGRSPGFQRAFGAMLFDVHVAPAPYIYRFPISDLRLPIRPQSAIGNRQSAIVCDQTLAAVEAILQQHAPSIAAIAVEPLVQAAAGIITHPVGFLRGLRELATRYDVLLICDEIAVGFGRSGRMFACEHEGVVPDLMCVGKGLTGGYLPLAATLATRKIYDAFLGEPWSGRTFFHGHTFTGNPLACAAALASIELIEREDVLAHVRAMSGVLASQLEPLTASPRVGDIRQCGLMVGIELIADRATKRPFDARARVGAELCKRVRRHGVILRPLGDVITIVPPLVIDASSLKRIVDAVAMEIDAIGDVPASISNTAIDPAGDA